MFGKPKIANECQDSKTENTNFREIPQGKKKQQSSSAQSDDAKKGLTSAPQDIQSTKEKFVAQHVRNLQNGEAAAK